MSSSPNPMAQQLAPMFNLVFPPQHGPLPRADAALEKLRAWEETRRTRVQAPAMQRVLALAK
jgi:hypothetical protein